MALFFAIPGLPRQTLLKIFCSAGEENYLVNRTLLQSIAKMRCNKMMQDFFWGISDAHEDGAEVCWRKGLRPMKSDRQFLVFLPCGA